MKSFLKSEHGKCLALAHEELSQRSPILFFFVFSFFHVFVILQSNSYFPEF